MHWMVTCALVALVVAIVDALARGMPLSHVFIVLGAMAFGLALDALRKSITG
jgi:hypothetical protein